MHCFLPVDNHSSALIKCMNPPILECAQVKSSFNHREELCFSSCLWMLQLMLLSPAVLHISVTMEMKDALNLAHFEFAQLVVCALDR